MKKSIIILSSLFLTIIMQAQDRTQPKPGPAPKINIKKPVSFTLPNGLKVLVVEDHKLPRVSYNLTIDNAPYAEGNKKGVDDLTSSLLGNGSVKTSKDAFNEEIDFLGANINFYSSGASANGLSKYSKRILELMAEGALQPNFTQEEFDKEKDKLIDGLKTQEKSVPAVASRVENVLVYGKENPSGEYLTEETINNVSLSDIKANYGAYFVPENAYLVIVGDVKYKDIKALVEKEFGSWIKAKAPNVTYSAPSNPQYTQINFVDMPNAVQSEISIVNAVKLKVADPDFFPVIVANQVLGGDFNSYLNMNLREAHGWTYGARSSVGTNKYQISKFKANSQVRNAVTDSAVVEFLKEIKRIRTEKVTDEVLNNVKAGYVGRFVMQVEKPETVARYALNIQTEKLPADFYENYIKNIQAVTPDDVMRVMNKYVLADNLRIIITGKGSEVIPGLEKLKIPIFYFDKFGNPAEKPSMKKPVPTGVTLKTVLDNYIKAVGGEKAVAGVKTVSSVSSGEIQGTPLELSSKAMIGSKMAVEMKAMGMTMMKQVVNDKTGYVEQQGQRKDLEADKIAEMKESSMPFSELSMLKNNTATLDGIEAFNGADAYVVKSGKSTIYYDVATGLKLARSTEQEAGGKKMTQTMTYADYRDLKGIKVPYKMTMSLGPQEIEFVTSEMKINEGVADKDFE
jgi:predicted Zn-dependent peptidase